MNESLVQRVADAVLYEGYLLYPYRPNVKNQHRWTFGGLYPKAWSTCHPHPSDAPLMRSQCLIHDCDETTIVRIKARFLHIIDRRVGRVLAASPVSPRSYDANAPRTEPEPTFEQVESLDVDDRQYHPWQEASPREVGWHGWPLADLLDRPRTVAFTFPASRTTETLNTKAGDTAGALMRRQDAVIGRLSVEAHRVAPALYQLTLTIANQADLSDASRISRDEALMRTLVSTHALLHVAGGRFVSLIDPPPHCAEHAQACRGIGCYPVLVGEAGSRDAMLASPIILYDHPCIAPQSPGDLFDGTEIDEILSLRIRTLSDEERRQVAATDERGRALLERTEALARDQLMSLHGLMHREESDAPDRHGGMWDEPPTSAERRGLASTQAAGAELAVGDHVRLHPRRSADAMDVLLGGMIATITHIEQDYEDRIHLAVTLDDDPGADLGEMGKIGHRFFFSPEEVEPVEVGSRG